MIQQLERHRVKMTSTGTPDQKNTNARLTFAQKYLDDPKEFGGKYSVDRGEKIFAFWKVYAMLYLKQHFIKST